MVLCQLAQHLRYLRVDGAGMFGKPGKLLDAALVKDGDSLLLGNGRQGSSGNFFYCFAHIAAHLLQGHRLT